MKTVAFVVLMSCLSLGYGSGCSAIIKGDPLTIEQSVGRWSLVAMAHEINETIISDVGLDHAFMEVYLKDGVPHLTHLSIKAGMPRRFETEDLAVKDGYLTYTSTFFGGKPAFRYVSDDCTLFSFAPPGDIHFFYCRSKLPSTDDIRKIIEYSICQNYQHIVIRRDSALSCVDIPHERKDFDLETLKGKWKMVAKASVVPKYDIDIPAEIHFIVDGERVILSTGEGRNVSTGWRSTNRIDYRTIDLKGDAMVFYESPEDSLLIWTGGEMNHLISLMLLSRTGHLQHEEIRKFKNFAACLSARVVFLKE